MPGQPPPVPVTVTNLASSSGPPWWATTLIAVASALLTLAVTTYITRSREHQKWVWERRIQLYVELFPIVVAMDSVHRIANHDEKPLTTLFDRVIDNEMTASLMFFESVKVNRARSDLDQIAEEQQQNLDAYVASGIAGIEPEQNQIDADTRLQSALDRLVNTLYAEVLHPPKIFLSGPDAWNREAYSRWLTGAGHGRHRITPGGGSTGR